MVNNKIVFFQILIFLLSISCGNPQREKPISTSEHQIDEFYSAPKNWDLFRFPLIKPVQAISVIGYGDSWSVKLPYQQINETMSSVEVKRVNVLDSVIVIDAGLVSLPGETTQAWFLIDMKQKTESVHTTFADYEKGLSKVGINYKPELYDVNEIYRNFKEKGTLPF